MRPEYIDQTKATLTQEQILRNQIAELRLAELERSKREARVLFANWVRNHIYHSGRYDFPSTGNIDLYQDDRRGDYAIPVGTDEAYQFSRSGDQMGKTPLLSDNFYKQYKTQLLQISREQYPGYSDMAIEILIHGKVMGTYGSSKGRLIRYRHNERLYVIYGGNAYDLEGPNPRKYHPAVPIYDKWNYPNVRF